MKLIASSLLLTSLALTAAHAQKQIQHVVIIFQENRTPDNLFHGLPGADIANFGVNSKGKLIRLKPIPLANNYDVLHTHSAFLSMYDNGKMDGADKVKALCSNGNQKCLPADPQFKYVRHGDVAPYFQLAEQYTFADRMFQTNQGPSFPAHQFIISGTSAPSASSDLFVADEPEGGQGDYNRTGCTAPPGQFVFLIDPSGDESQRIYPCFDHPTLTDLLRNAGKSWRYYTPSASSIWTGPNAISHIRFGWDWQNVILQPNQIFKDITNNQLPSVSWVIPTWAESDHAGANDGTGPSWVASIVNAISVSPYWPNTVIFITWDDWGGWYDHVAPPIYNSYEYGFRVPLIVVSPYAKQGYVSHVTHDFGSILKFIEGVFDLPSLGYADERADDLSDCFQFDQMRHGLPMIRAPHDADYFLNRPPLRPGDPDDY